MYLSILDFRKGEVQIIEMDDDDKRTNDSDIIKRLGHTDYAYMVTDKLKLNVDNEC